MYVRTYVCVYARMYVCNIRVLTYVTCIHSALAVFALCLEPVQLKQSFSQLKSSFYHLMMRTADTGFPYTKASHSKHVPSLLGVVYCRLRSLICVFLLQDRNASQSFTKSHSSSRLTRSFRIPDNLSRVSCTFPLNRSYNLRTCIGSDPLTVGRSITPLI